MITPQLVAFMREQLAAGIPREAIRQSLLLNEWTDQDIDEAFALMPVQAPAAEASVARWAAPNPFVGRKLVLSLGFILVSIVYAMWQNLGGGQSALTQTSPAGLTPSQSAQAANAALLQTLAKITAAAPPPAGTTTKTSPVSQTPTPAPKPAGQYADGSYTGSAANAYYGTVQVKAVIQNGQLADVQFLQYPSDRSTSRYINGQAMPMLTQEALTVQSANVDGVSGATFTSQAFQQSLASALALAKN